ACGCENDAGAMVTTPREAVTTIAANPQLDRGSDERFTGYGAMGVPFSGGHYLGLRDMLASSLGTPYRTVWYRDPARQWTMFTSVDPNVSCPRYFGSATAVEQVPAIEVTWRDDWTVDVAIGARLSWRLMLVETPATRSMTVLGGATPSSAWNSAAVLGAMGPMAGALLRSGRIRLCGFTPNGQGFKAAPLRVWRVSGGHATLDGNDLGAMGPLAQQTHLGDFWLPQRGLFFAGRARFTVAARATDARHETAGLAMTP
ncbi:MAG: hypothetical protein ACOYBY_18550, partial [Dermatophilaceae bacterium]